MSPISPTKRFNSSPAASPTTKKRAMATGKAAAVNGGPKMMPHIPIEVLRQISVHLDLPSAAALARTCKALRDAGEVRVWEEVDLTCGGDHYSETWNWNQADHDSALSTCKSRIAARQAAIESYPARAEWIRAVRLEPEGGRGGSLAKSVISFLNLVSNSIRRLYVLPCIYTSQPSPSGHPITFDNYFLNGLSEIGVFPRVEELATFDFEGPTTTFSLVRKCPNLKALDTSMGSALPSDRPAHATFPPMPKLERFVFSHMENIELFDYDDIRIDLIQLFDVAPRLREMKLGGWSSEWRISTALRKRLRRLESLALFAHDYGALGRLGVPLPTPGDKTSEEVPQTLEQLVMSDLIAEDNEINLDSLELPKITSLKRLTLLTSPRISAADYAAMGIAPVAKRVSHMDTIVVRQLNQAPNLTTIQLMHSDGDYPPTYASPNADNSSYFAPPTTWEKEGHRGILIRTYGTATPLIHTRGLSRSMQTKKGESYVGARRSWRNFAKYRHRTVPYAVLELAYAAGNLSMEWLEGGRGMRFGADEESAVKAWAVLNAWRDAADDMSDVEYDEDEEEESEGSDSDGDVTDDDDLPQYFHPPHHMHPPGFHPPDFDDFDEDGEEGWETDDDGGDPIGMWDY